MSLDPILANHPRRAQRFEFPVESSDATKLAAGNFERNRAALERSWPRTVIALPEALPELEWLFARDGALSARHVDQRWFNDTSVPRRAAERMIKQLAPSGRTAVMLAPTHACQVRRVLDLLPATHALVVIVPGETNAGVMIACDDFSAELGSGRLWLAVGPDWQEELKAILEGNDGLMPPQTMVRVPGLNAAVVEVISRSTDALLATHGKNHRQLISLLLSKPRSPQRPVRRACVVTSGFELWDDGGWLLGEAAKRASVEVVAVNVASPTQASDLKLARAAEGCDCVVTANAGRADRPGLMPDHVPWITWATTAVPAFVPSAADDRLIIADEALHATAASAGWPAERVMVARESWHDRLGHERGAHVTPSIILNLPEITVPAAIQEMSSLRLVWELIERELTGRALRDRGGVDHFILQCADRIGVQHDAVPLATFRDALVLPLFAREVTLELATNDVDFTIHGRGWETFPQLASRHQGPITSGEAFSACLAQTSALLDVWPGVATHPALRVGVPTISPWGRTLKAVTASLRSAKAPPAKGSAFELDAVLSSVR